MQIRLDLNKKKLLLLLPPQGIVLFLLHFFSPITDGDGVGDGYGV